MHPVSRSGNKAHPFVHFATLLPGHLRLPQKPKVSAMCPEWSVNHVPERASNRSWSNDTVENSGDYGIFGVIFFHLASPTDLVRWT
jgi:hypothetical protein